MLQTLMMAMGNVGLFLVATCRIGDPTGNEDFVNYLVRKKKAELVKLEPFSKSETSVILKDKLPVLWKENVTSAGFGTGPYRSGSGTAA